MAPVLLTKMMTSMKKELIIILVVVTSLFALPLIAIVSMADIGGDIKALADSALHFYQGPVSTSNTYTFGYCTFWAAKRREGIGKPIPNNWGDAHTWDDRAKLAGYLVDHTPQEGAIMETDRGDLGHVAFVEKVDVTNGSWTISQMNAPVWDVVNSKTYTAIEAQDYNFIH